MEYFINQISAMNIAIDVRALMHGKTSGVEIYIKNLLKNLFESDSENQYFLYYNAFNDVSKNIPSFDFSNVQTLSTKYPNKLFNIFLSLFRYPKLDKLLGKISKTKIDFFLVPDPRPTPVSQKCSKITVVHDLSFLRYRKTFSLKTRIWHKLLKLKKELKESAKILCVSRFTELEVFKEFPFCKGKTLVEYAGVPEGIERILDKKKLEYVREKYNLPEKFYLTLSTLEPRKNLSKLVESFQEWKKETNEEEKLVVAGISNTKLFAKTSLIESDPNIVFPGFIDEKDKSTLYSLAEAFFFVSLYEGFGFPLLEAKKCGLPIICSQTSSMPEVAGERGVFFVNPLEEESIREGFKRVKNIKFDLDNIQKKTEFKKFQWGNLVKTLQEKIFIVE